MREKSGLFQSACIEIPEKLAARSWCVASTPLFIECLLCVLVKRSQVTRTHSTSERQLNQAWEGKGDTAHY
jgi:hypothetical protein